MIRLTKPEASSVAAGFLAKQPAKKDHQPYLINLSGL
jgi:hypothetical protein